MTNQQCASRASGCDRATTCDEDTRPNCATNGNELEMSRGKLSVKLLPLGIGLFLGVAHGRFLHSCVITRLREDSLSRRCHIEDIKPKG